MSGLKDELYQSLFYDGAMYYPEGSTALINSIGLNQNNFASIYYDITNNEKQEQILVNEKYKYLIEQNPPPKPMFAANTSPMAGSGCKRTLPPDFFSRNAVKVK